MLPAGIEEAQFQRVPEEWLFTAPSPWVFAPRRSYLVTEADKPAFAAQVRRGRHIRLILLAVMLLLLAAVLILVPSLMTTPSLSTWPILAGYVLVTTFVVVLGDYLAVRSLVRNVPRSSQKVRLRDVLLRQSKMMSVKALVILTSFSLST